MGGGGAVPTLLLDSIFSEGYYQFIPKQMFLFLCNIIKYRSIISANMSHAYLVPVDIHCTCELRAKGIVNVKRYLGKHRRMYKPCEHRHSKSTL